MSLAAALVRCWYGRGGWCRWLIPFSWLFSFVSWLRRQFYRLGWLRITRLPVPVVVIGNITAGGTGKTPLVIWLVGFLKSRGHTPGVVSRGYGADDIGARQVSADADPAEFGDEPVLIARRVGCPVWVGRRRVETGRALLAAHPGIDVIVADDGLQHYALGRDVEVAVVDGGRGVGNGRRIPAGPLREPVGRLREVDAVVVNGGGWSLPACRTFEMRLEGERFHALNAPQRVVAKDYFSGRPVHAVAGIGHPQRFFDALTSLGLDVIPHPFPDHHAYRAEDLPAGTVIMTEKDAVKCAAFGHDDAWVLAVDAGVEEGLERHLLEKLESVHGQQAA